MKRRFALWLLLALILAAVLVPWLSPWTQDGIDWQAIRVAPFTDGHILGADNMGRDLLTRSFAGLRVSLAIAVAAATTAMVIGMIWGAVAAYLGGLVDGVMMRFVDIFYALPFLFLVIVLTLLFGRSLALLFLAIAAVEWLTMARIMRAQTLSLKVRPFILAAEAAGLNRFQIIVRHILPNIFGLALVYAAISVPNVVMAESFLSFLGLGVQEPATSLGLLIKEGADDMETAPHILMSSGGLMLMLLASLTLVSEQLRKGWQA